MEQPVQAIWMSFLRMYKKIQNQISNKNHKVKEHLNKP